MKSKKEKANKKWYKQILKVVNSKKAISNAKDKFSYFLELPEEVISKSTKITIINNNNILIEGYKQIVDYYDDYIKIKTNSLEIVIDGRNLDIKEITDYELVIEGSIYSLNYQI